MYIVGCKEGRFTTCPLGKLYLTPTSLKVIFLPARKSSFASRKNKLFCSQGCHIVEFFLSPPQYVNDYHAFRNTFFERKNDVKTMKQKFSMDTLNDNINNAKSYPVTVLHSPFCNQKKFPIRVFLSS